MSDHLDDNDWELLTERILVGKCTPFLGAGVHDGVLPLGGEMSRALAHKFGYPFEDSSDLANVAQFVSIKADAMAPKDEVIRHLQANMPDDSWKPGRLLSILAELPVPIFITTNYDDLLTRALIASQKQPKHEVCRWNSLLRKQPSVLLDGFDPGAATPVVFHLHGHMDRAESLVLTEDDYLSFLVNVSRFEDLLPPRIQEALTGSSLLFLGYRMADWSFRVLFRGLVRSMEDGLRRISIAVQLDPKDVQRREYLDDYFGLDKIKVFWGTAEDFAEELGGRLEARKE